MVEQTIFRSQVGIFEHLENFIQKITNYNSKVNLPIVELACVSKNYKEYLEEKQQHPNAFTKALKVLSEKSPDLKIVVPAKGVNEKFFIDLCEGFLKNVVELENQQQKEEEIAKLLSICDERAKNRRLYVLYGQALDQAYETMVEELDFERNSKFNLSDIEKKVAFAEKAIQLSASEEFKEIHDQLMNPPPRTDITIGNSDAVRVYQENMDSFISKIIGFTKIVMQNQNSSLEEVKLIIKTIENDKIKNKNDLAIIDQKNKTLNEQLKDQADLFERHQDLTKFYNSLEKNLELKRNYTRSARTIRNNMDECEDNEDMDGHDKYMESLKRLEEKQNDLNFKISQSCKEIKSASYDKASHNAKVHQTAESGIVQNLTYTFPEFPRKIELLLKNKSNSKQGVSKKQEAERALEKIGLLMEFRNEDSYEFEDIPDVLKNLSNDKSHINGAKLKSSYEENVYKALKTITFLSFKENLNEITIASRLKNEFIVKIEGAYVDKKGSIVLQTPFYAGGTLKDWVANKKIDCEQNIFYILKTFSEIAQAVNCVHEYNIIHRDIKPQNILMEKESWNTRSGICDFELSKQSLCGVTMQTRIGVGTRIYMAPELEESMASKKSDIFALGVTLLEIWCYGNATMPLQQFNTVLNLEKALNQMRTGEDNSWNNYCGDARFEKLTSLVVRMTDTNPENRPNITTVLNTITTLLENNGSKECSGFVCGGSTINLAEPNYLICSEQHYMCKICIEDGVKAFRNLEVADRKRKGCGFPCGKSKHNVDRPMKGFECESTAFTLKELSPILDEDEFNAYVNCINEIEHVDIHLKLEKVKNEEIEKVLKNSADENARLQMKRAIAELLTHKCPKCNRAFEDYDGCAALVCPACKCGFCACCFRDCGRDAHDHVTRCKYNPNRPSYGFSIDNWLDMMVKRKRKLLKKYWDELTPSNRELARADDVIRGFYQEFQLELYMQ